MTITAAVTQRWSKTAAAKCGGFIGSHRGATLAR